MKRLSLYICLIIITLLLTGCGINDKETNSILKELEKNNIIASGYKEIDKEEHAYYDLEHCSKTYTHIYKDKDSNLFAIDIFKVTGTKEYSIYIYSKVGINNDIQYWNKDKVECSEGYYKTKDDKLSKNAKYIVSNSKSYTAIKDKNNNYTITEKEEK